MSDHILGIHHVTAISGAPQDNLDFMVGVLDQRFVKRTVNFDAPDTYHLYYGDHAGSPGTVMTFFPFVDAGPGKAGAGMASAVAYAVPPGGLEAWMERLAGMAIDFAGPSERLGERMIAIKAPDGLCIELIETDRAKPSTENTMEDGFHSVTLQLGKLEPTAKLLGDLFGYREVGSVSAYGEERLRFMSPAAGRGSVIDLVAPDLNSEARPGAGTIHHVAFRAVDDADQAEWRERVAAAGFGVTPVIDRQYFNAIYFREPGGTLFEIATDPPGFTADEPLAELGQHLMLPPQHEPKREQITRKLPEIRVPAMQ